MKEMFNASVNSLPTSITIAISDTDTEIYVSDITRIPQPPNLLVLGENTEIAETVKLVDVDTESNRIIVRRGFQGEARSWSANTSVSRNFTAYDHDTFIENIEGVSNTVGDVQTAVEDLSLMKLAGKFIKHALDTNNPHQTTKEQ